MLVNAPGVDDYSSCQERVSVALHSWGHLMIGRFFTLNAAHRAGASSKCVAISCGVLAAFTQACGHGATEQYLLRNQNSRYSENLISGRFLDFYHRCIISRAQRTPDDISDAKLRCVAPTVEFCEETLQDEGNSRAKAREVCSPLVFDEIDWTLEYANAIECDSGACVVIRR